MSTYIKQAVNSIIQNHSSRDPFYIAEIYNIRMEYYNLGEHVRGIYVRESNNRQWIGIHNKLNHVMQKFIAAHEIGHSILHPKTSKFYVKKNTLFFPDKLEREANIFAAEFLINSTDLYKLLGRRESLEWIAYELEVPIELLQMKMNFF